MVYIFKEGTKGFILKLSEIRIREMEECKCSKCVVAV